MVEATTPAPRTWYPEMLVSAPALRADITNLATLLTNRPCLLASNQTQSVAVPASTITGALLDTEYLDNWNGHVVGHSYYTAQIAGMYLCEGGVTFSSTSTTTAFEAGIQLITESGPSTRECFGVIVQSNGTNNPAPFVSDLCLMQPGDQVAICAYQNSGGTIDLASSPGAYYSVRWCGLPTSGASAGTVVTSPVAAALWPPGSGTTLSSGISAGATSMTVGSNTGMVVNGTLGLEYSGGVAQSGYAETVTISSVAGTTIGTSATTYAHSAGAAIAVPVSSAWMNQQVRDIINFLAYPPMARLVNSGTSQSVTTQTFPAGTAVQWTAATYDNFSGWSAGSSTEYVFPVAGVYYIYGAVVTPSGPNNISVGLGISGGTIAWGDSQRLQSSLDGGTSVRKRLRVTAGQYVQLFVSVSNTGGTLPTGGLGGSNISTLVVVWEGF
jgi:hypothetical protein